MALSSLAIALDGFSISGGQGEIIKDIRIVESLRGVLGEEEVMSSTMIIEDLVAGSVVEEETMTGSVEDETKISGRVDDQGTMTGVLDED